MNLADCFYLTGPTASGKTAAGVALAVALRAEIISMDSMAVFRGMNIGTAKPTLAERQQVPHHLLDVVEPDQDFSVAQYLELAQSAADDIASRGQRVLFVGGTPLYLKSLLRGLFRGPPADWALREELLETAREQGGQALHGRLAAVDPQSAARLHPGDTRRVVRALEVWAKTGQSISSLQREFETARPADACRVFALTLPRDQLVARIDTRVEQMFAAGQVEETRQLLERFGSLGRTAAQAVGYREVIEHLSGERSLPETVELVKLRTRQFAKRQMTWFRSLSECRSLECTSEDNPATLARRLAEACRNWPK